MVEDRPLSWTDTHATVDLPRSDRSRPAVRVRLVVASRAVMFAVLAAYILLGPWLVQIRGVQHPLLRPWTMYSGVGVGMLDGAFVVEGRADGPITHTPLEVLGLERYPIVAFYAFPDRVLADEDLPRVAARFCARLGQGETLAFAGRVGTRQGWRAIAMDDLCGETGR